MIHDEIGTKAYMEELREFVKTTPHDNVKNKVLELIQAWAFAFRNSPKYRAVQVLCCSGCKFVFILSSKVVYVVMLCNEHAHVQFVCFFSGMCNILTFLLYIFISYIFMLKSMN